MVATIIQQSTINIVLLVSAIVLLGMTTTLLLLIYFLRRSGNYSFMNLLKQFAKILALPTIFIIYYFFWTIVLPNLVLLGLGGIESLDYYSAIKFYAPLGITLGIVLFIISLVQRIVRVSGLYETKLGLLGTYTFDSENDGWADAGKIKWIKNQFSLFLISHLFFGFVTYLLLFIFPLLGIHPIQFTGLPPTQYEFLPSGQVIGGMEPYATVETALVILFIGLIGHIWKWISRNAKPYVQFIGIILISIIIGGVGFSFYHNQVYGSDESALASTGVFGAAGSFVTMVTGSFIPFQSWHISNNGLLKASKVFGNEAVTFWVGFFYLLLFLGTAVYIYYIYRKKRRTSNQITFT